MQEPNRTLLNIITIFIKSVETVDINIINVISSNNISFKKIFTNSDDVEVFRKKSNVIFDGDKNYIRISKQGNILESVFNKIFQNFKLIKDICFINTGFDSSADRITKSNLNKAYNEIPENINIGDGIFILKEEEYQNIKPEKELVYKCYKNSDIEKYISNKWQNLYVIWTNKNTDITKYPNIKKHLERSKNILDYKSTEHGEVLPWFSQHRAREYDVFGNKDKIVFPYRSKSNIFSYSNSNYFGSKDILYLRQKDEKFNIKYLLALLNSKLYYTWLYYKGKRKGETLELYVTPISQIPIKDITTPEQKPFKELVDKIISKKEAGEDTTVEERKIDLMVYKLYDLTFEEVKIIEPEFELTKKEYENYE